MRGHGRGGKHKNKHGGGKGFSANTPFFIPKHPMDFVEDTSNKDSSKAVQNKITILKDKCTGCGICVDICPRKAIVLEDIAIVDQEKCTACFICVTECPQQAIIP